VPVAVEYRKWPDTLHWHFPVEPLGEDAHGRWLHLRKGTRVQRGSEPPIAYPATSVLLVPEAQWWTALFCSDRDGDCELYIDVATPATWTRAGDGGAEQVTMIDLDLDVVRRWNGRVDVLDRDEFALHRVQLGYPEAVAASAARAAEELVAMLASGAEPFASAGAAWRARALASP